MKKLLPVRLGKGMMMTGLLGGGGGLPGPGYAYGPDLITNGGFETAGAGGVDPFSWWSETAGTGAIAADAVIYRSGAKSVKQTAGSTSPDCYFYSSDIPVTPGQMYLATRYLYGDGTNRGQFSVYDATHSTWIKELISNRWDAASWGRRYTTFVAPAGCLAVRLFSFAPRVIGATLNTDDVSVYAWQPPAYFYDNFARPDGDLDRSPGGFAYDVDATGTTSFAQIVGGKMQQPAGLTGGRSHCFIDLPSIPTVMRGTGGWINDAAGPGDGIVFGCSNDSRNIRVYKHMLHFYITTTEWQFQVVDDAGTFTSLGTGPLALSPDTPYQIAMAISGNTVTLTIPTLADQVITNALIGTYAGKFVFYQADRFAANAKTAYFSYIEARY